MLYILCHTVPIAQLDNAPPSEGGDCGFESRWARQKLNRQMAVFCLAYVCYIFLVNIYFSH